MSAAAVAVEPLKLNLGCGKSSVPGYVGVDKIRTETTDLVLDLERYPWPWANSSVSDAVLIHVLEHISDPIPFMNELWRIMQPGGHVIVVGPHAQSD